MGGEELCVPGLLRDLYQGSMSIPLLWLTPTPSGTLLAATGTHGGVSQPFL